MPIRQDGLLRCNFCGKTENQVEKIIAGPTVYICNECSDICLEILDDDIDLKRPDNVSILRALTYQYVTQDLTEPERLAIEEKIHEVANATRSRRRERAGSVVAGYKLVRIVGSGNFGAVWEGLRDTRTGVRADSNTVQERAAVKIFDISKLTIGLMLWRFSRGIRAMQHLTAMHRIAPRSILRIFDTSPDGLAFSMQYLPGGDLQNISRLGWSKEKKLDVFSEICIAVQFAHSQGIIHRDIKPANIVLTSDNLPVLTDFDIAEIKFAATLSVRAGSLGTPQFAAPEQLVEKSIEAEPTADIYSLGKLLYYLSTETAPPFGSTEPDVIPAYLKRLEDATIRELIARAIQHEPSDRFQSVGEIIEFLPKGGRRLKASEPSSHRIDTPATEPPSSADNTLTVVESPDAIPLVKADIVELIPKVNAQPHLSLRWAPIAGVGFGGISLLFFMILVIVSLEGHSVPKDSKFLVTTVLALSTSLSVSFLGGSAAADGTLPISGSTQHPIRFAVTGGLAMFVLTLVLGYAFYVR